MHIKIFGPFFIFLCFPQKQGRLDLCSWKLNWSGLTVHCVPKFMSCHNGLSSRKYPYPYHGWHCWDWNSECMRGFLVLEFRRGGGAKNSDLLTSEVQKTSPVCARAKQTELQRYDYEVGMRSLFTIAMKRLLSSVVPVVF